MLPNLPSISVFFPAYNDEGSIEQMVADALAVLPTLSNDYEVIVVNDGSTDATGSVLEQLKRTSPFVKIIHHESNQGYGAALRTGFSHSCKDLIFYTDGDGQYDARELVALFPLMTDAVDIVNGYKVKRADRRRRIILGAIYKRVARLFFSLPIRDVDCDFRLIRRRAIQQIQLSSSSGVICTEMMRKLYVAGYAFVETPVSHYPRSHGQSQFFTLRRVGRTAYDFFVLWWKIVALRSLFPDTLTLQHREAKSAELAEQARASSE
jgi:glycosyltransferase involved in cell wall biosynthesis